MANIYLRSTDGNDADDGSTWALAKATLASAITAAGAGGTVYVSQAHNESVAVYIPGSVLGSITAPTKIICGNDSAEPPTVNASTAVLTTSSNSLTVNQSAWIEGLQFHNTYGGSLNFSFGSYPTSGRITCKDCSFQFDGAGGPYSFSIGDLSTANDRTVLNWINTSFKPAPATGTQLQMAAAEFNWIGGALITNTTLPTYLFGPRDPKANGTVLVENVDLSVLGSGKTLVDFSATTWNTSTFTFRNCKLGASVAIVNSIGTPGCRVRVHNCDSADTHYRFHEEDYAGAISQETTIVRTGGASDGVTPISWKMVTNTKALFPAITCESPELPALWNDTVGSAITVTVELVHDTNVREGQGAGTSYAYQNDEFYLDISYLGTSGVPLGVRTSSSKATLAAAADNASSSVTWTTTGLTTPVKQKLTATFTPQEAGYIHAKVIGAKASKTVYICPKMTVA